MVINPMRYWKKNALPKNKKEIQPQQAISFSSCLTFAANHTIPIPPKRSPTPTKNVKIRLPSPSPKKGHQTTKNGRRNFRCQQVTGVLCFNNIPMSFLGHCLEVLVSSFATTSKKVKRGISEWWKTLVGSVPPWGEKHLGSLQNGLGVKLF